MKKLLLIKIVSLIIILTFSVSSFVIAAEKPIKITDNYNISPQNIAIILDYNNLTLGTLGKLTCDGQTEVQDGYSAGIIMELQEYRDNKWLTIKTWSAVDTDCVMLYQNWYVVKGTYRLKLTHEAYNSSMKLIESFVKYSKTIIYE